MGKMLIASISYLFDNPRYIIFILLVALLYVGRLIARVKAKSFAGIVVAMILLIAVYAYCCFVFEINMIIATLGVIASFVIDSETEGGHGCP